MRLGTAFRCTKSRGRSTIPITTGESSAPSTDDSGNGLTFPTPVSPTTMHLIVWDMTLIHFELEVGSITKADDRSFSIAFARLCSSHSPYSAHAIVPCGT